MRCELLSDYEQLAADLAAKDKRDAEHQRLKDAAIEAAKEYTDYFFPPDASKELEPNSPGNRFLIAVNALVQFEKEHKA